MNPARLRLARAELRSLADRWCRRWREDPRVVLRVLIAACEEELAELDELEARR